MLWWCYKCRCIDWYSRHPSRCLITRILLIIHVHNTRDDILLNCSCDSPNKMNIYIYIYIYIYLNFFNVWQIYIGTLTQFHCIFPWRRILLPRTTLVLSSGTLHDMIDQYQRQILQEYFPRSWNPIHFHIEKYCVPNVTKIVVDYQISIQARHQSKEKHEFVNILLYSKHCIILVVTFQQV